MFKTNASRTWLTILGMGVGTSAVVALVGLGYGLQGMLLEKLVYGETLLSMNVSSPPSKIVVLDEAHLRNFLAIQHVKDVSPLASFSAIITYEGFSGNIVLQGVNPSYFKYTGINAVEGDLFTDKESGEDRNNVLVSMGMLKLFEVEDPKSAIGKRVKFRVLVSREGSEEQTEIPLEKEYRIKGVTSEEASISAMMTLAEFSSLFKIPYYERVQVRVDTSDFLNTVQAQIVEAGFTVTALSKTVEQANKIFQGVQAVLGVFGGIALVVSAIGMFNTMTVTLLERTSEIGIMRTIGASSRDIMILFVSEAVIIGFLGGLIGVGIGVIIGWTLNILLTFVASKFGGTAVNLFRYPFLFLAFIIIFSGVVGFITGLFPARRAAKLNPLDAIRYK
jgi:putative ABC transport system permease protein